MDAFAQASAILADNRAVLERSARALLERETLDEAALDELTADLRRPAQQPRDDAPAVREVLHPDEAMSGMK